MTEMRDEAEACAGCAEGGRGAFRHPFTMAFQPIFDTEGRRPFAHEALVRGADGNGAMAVLSHVTDENRYGFDQAARSKAIALAARQGLTAGLSINFMPNAVYDPDRCLRSTLLAADRFGFPVERIIFEFTEGEAVRDAAHLKNIVARYRARGFRTAIDDFGSGYSGLGLLADIQPDLIKIDMALIRGVDADPVRQEIVAAVAGLCERLGITPIAEGVETPGELAALRGLGIHLIQGYLLARPRLEGAPSDAEVLAALDEAEADTAWAGRGGAPSAAMRARA